MPGISSDLLRWYRAEGRDLPWRKTTDPYRILVSEVMLQQTPVDRVIPKYEAFLERFPTVRKLAEASLGDVLRLWSGLGYNRRAKHLWLCARALVNEGRGRLPRDAASLRLLPGIGPYTAAALACFAFDEPAVPLDTNLKRVFARLFFKGEEGDFGRVGLEVIRPAPRETANALMDLGATVCLPQPKCKACPLRKRCSAYKAGVPEKYPAPPRQSKFEGSRRMHRGRLLRRLKHGPLPVGDIAAVLDMPAPHARGIADELAQEGMVVFQDGCVRLP
jgi:A/G-specific adenine glycosylase